MEENKLLLFFRAHWSKICLGILALACVAAWTERYLKSHQSEGKRDYLLANQIFERLQKGEVLESETLATAEAILQRHPELHPKYDAQLAHTYFAQRNPAQAATYAAAAIKDAAGQLPELYAEYAQTTVLIARGEYSAAFEAALTLDKKIASAGPSPILGVLNKLRLFFLAENKKPYWDQLVTHPAFNEIAPFFHEGKLTLDDYKKTVGLI